MREKFKIISVLFVVFFMSCSVEDGNDGADGNANVITSEWIPTEFSTDPTAFSIFRIEDDNINEETTANAVIVAYGRTFADEIVTIPFVRSNRVYFFSLFPNTNEIIFRGETTSGQSIFGDLTHVRYTIIPSN